jgi:hypothetical protein
MRVYLCVILFVFYSCHNILLYSQETGEDIAKAMWNDIKSVKSSVADIPKKFSGKFDSYPIDPITIDESMLDYWDSISNQCQDIFIAALTKAHKNNQIENFAKEYAGFFGRDGAVADMRWVLTCPRLTTPDSLFINHHRSDAHIPSENYEYNKIAVLKEEVKIFSIAFVKAIVENSIKSKKYRKRMHHLNLWYGCFYFGDMTLRYDFEFWDEIKEEKITSKDFAYWHAVRRLISIAYLCDCDNIFDNMKDVNKKNVEEAYCKIFKYVRLIDSVVSYDQKTLRYTVNMMELKLPPITRPNVPFDDSYFSNKNDFNSLPRISPALVIMFISDNFNSRILKVIDVK